MNYISILTRIRKVVLSCTKHKQMQQARNYCFLIVRRYRANKTLNSGQFADLCSYSKLICMSQESFLNRNATPSPPNGWCPFCNVASIGRCCLCGRKLGAKPSPPKEGE